MKQFSFIGKKVIVYQSNKVEGEATITKLLMWNGTKTDMVYCDVVFDNEPDKVYMRWINPKHILETDGE